MVKTANDYYKRAIELSPNHGITYLKWARTDIEISDYEAAKDKIARAEAINPQNGNVWWAKAIVFANQNEDDAVTASVYRAFNLNYQTYSLFSLIELGEVYCRAENWKKMFGVYRAMIRLYPWNINGFIQLANVYRNLERNDQALFVLESVLPNSNYYYQEIIKREIIEINSK